jgi:predicted MPP superfamily phosphohydrolase
MLQIIFFFALLFLLDLYIFQAVKAVSRSVGSTAKIGIYILFWILALSGSILMVMLPTFRGRPGLSPMFTYALSIALGLLIAKLLAVSFFIVDDLRRFLQWVVAQFWVHNIDAAPGHEKAEAISRSVFLSWAGIGLGSLVFGTLLYGFRNKYNYHIRKQVFNFPTLPVAFKGFKVVHISDIHSGSFMDKEAVQRGVSMILDLKPDLILFTGDLVNDRAVEMEPYMEVFNRLKAEYGVYSVLGNHDYGDYTQWESNEAKEANLKQLKRVHAQLGWKLLLDESVSLEKDGDTIGIIGVQNISGKGNFHSYGNLQKAYADSAAQPFKMLMSHDPSHWDNEVRPRYPDIDLTLSGHTHGMQFGVEIPGFKWSPVQWIYKQWAGLYEKDGQKLYVNRGFGFIGYPGRVGILPEITLIELG